MKALQYSYFFLVIVLISCQEEHVEDYSGGGYLSPGSTGDQYNQYPENPFVDVADQAVSTFSVDADGASYANVRRFLMEDNRMPQAGAVRVEEMINYFNLDYPSTTSGHPIALNGEVSSCPWDTAHKLIRIGIKGKDIPRNQLPASNFVFLIDVSGSMSGSDRLPLLKAGFKRMVDELKPNDRVAIVTYSGSAAVALNSTAASQKQAIKNAIDALGSGGSTAGAEGIKSAYSIAQANLIEDGNNRIILGTDGDFNVGVSSENDLVNLIEKNRDSGIFLTILGVGRGNLNDASLEQIANHGNGTYEYIDRMEQMEKIFIHDYKKFYTVAKDVKVQVEFNPQNVESYRLIGYENRVLNESDFNNDTVDAGEIGVNQNVTALYEIVPAPLLLESQPTFTVHFRYKNPDSQTSQLLNLDIYDYDKTFATSSNYMKFTSSVAAFGMLLQGSSYSGNATYGDILTWLSLQNSADPHGLKQELEALVGRAQGL